MTTRTLTGLMFVAAFAGAAAVIENADPAPLCVAVSARFPAGAETGMPATPLFLTLPTARPIGEGGVSTISSAAGRNASSCRSRRAPRGSALTFLASG